MTDKPDAGEAKDEKRFGALDVVAIAQETYLLARTTDGALVAYPRDESLPRVATEIRSLRPMLTRRLMDEGRAVGRDTMTAALDVLQALAADSPEERVYLRCAEVGKAVHLDLAQRSGSSTFVEVSAFGWEIRDPKDEKPGAARPVFRRTSPTKALPIPVTGGSRDDLRDLLGLEDDDARWLLVWGWLVASLFESVPRPILWTTGAQGSGKSTRTRMILSILEPCDSLGGPPGKNEKDDSTSARGRFLPSWDNLGNISAQTSDWLCRLVTGVEIDRRALYTDDDVRTTVLRRSGVATSITLPVGLGSDALERLVVVDFERLSDTERRTEATLWTEFHRRHGRILGALLDDVAGVLQHLGSLREDPPKSLPRMADFSLILAALDEHLGLPEDDGFFQAYRDNVSRSLGNRAQDDPFTVALVRLAARGGGAGWEGTAKALHDLLADARDEHRGEGFPRSERGMADAIKRHSETLRAVGVIATVRRTKHGQTITLAPGEDFEPLPLATLNGPPSAPLRVIGGTGSGDDAGDDPSADLHPAV